MKTLFPALALACGLLLPAAVHANGCGANTRRSSNTQPRPKSDAAQPAQPAALPATAASGAATLSTDTAGNLSAARAPSLAAH